MSEREYDTPILSEHVTTKVRAALDPRPAQSTSLCVNPEARGRLGSDMLATIVSCGDLNVRPRWFSPVVFTLNSEVRKNHMAIDHRQV